MADNAISLIEQLREIVTNSPGGTASPAAKEKIEEIANELRFVFSGHSYFLEKLGHFELWSDRLYSARKWRDWGAERCRVSALGEVMTMLSLAMEHEERRSP